MYVTFVLGGDYEDSRAIPALAIVPVQAKAGGCYFHIPNDGYAI